MGLPIFQEPATSTSKSAACSTKLCDSTSSARSSIRRQSSVYPTHRARTYRVPRSPPPRAHPPPAFPLEPQTRRSPPQLSRTRTRNGRYSSLYDFVQRSNVDMRALLDVQEPASARQTHSPGPLEQSSRVPPPSDANRRHHYRRQVNMQELVPDDPINELPMLRRMGDRSITDPPTVSFRSILDPANDSHIDGLGDRNRSPSPVSQDDDQWETLLTTITPDPSVPSASTSFNSAPTRSFGEIDPAQAPTSGLRTTVHRLTPPRARPVWARTVDTDGCDDIDEDSPELNLDDTRSEPMRALDEYPPQDQDETHDQDQDRTTHSSATANYGQDPRYTLYTPRELSTNLAYLMQQIPPTNAPGSNVRPHHFDQLMADLLAFSRAYGVYREDFCGEIAQPESASAERWAEMGERSEDLREMMERMKESVGGREYDYEFAARRARRQRLHEPLRLGGGV